MKTGLYPPLRQCLGGSPPRGSSRLRVHAMMEKVEFAFVLCYWRRRKNTKRYVLLNINSWVFKIMHAPAAVCCSRVWHRYIHTLVPRFM